MAKTDPECGNVRDTLVELALSSKSALPEGVSGHIDNCEDCRLYAQGLKAAPQLFQGDSLYSPALKYRTLATAGSSRTGDLKIGLLLAVPVAASLLMSFLVQVYLVCLALSRIFSTGPLLWSVSIAVVTTLGAASGLLYLAAIARTNSRRKPLQEVLCD